MNSLNRRQFVRLSMMGIGSAVVSIGLAGCSGGGSGEAVSATQEPAFGSFQHGIASGDPLNDSVILWTRLTPAAGDENKSLTLSWEVATDQAFSNLVNNGSSTTEASRDFTVKVDVQGLDADTRYYYRFTSGDSTSAIGSTKTLPDGSPDMVKLLVLSCSNYPAGYFNVYKEAANVEGVDAAVHLGDYIYEYPRGGYASEDAEALNREVLPAGELLKLEDYRQRYGQYRTDEDLQSIHQKLPFIVTWDDHEIANDAWREGAENHGEDEGVFEDRRDAALQAYMEWMPIRPTVEGTDDLTDIQRTFEFGDLVNLMMLDTRIIGRDEQLDIKTLATPETQAALADPNRTLLGSEQQGSLQDNLANSTAKWQVLGQQVLMGEIKLPAAIATRALNPAEFVELARLAGLSPADLALEPPEKQLLLQQKGSLLKLPTIPYNLDAWDGYPAERAKVLASAAAKNHNLVVLAGDTHNAWANELQLGDNAAGVEFATAGVTSPGLEDYLKLDTLPEVIGTEQFAISSISDLKYANFSNRGFLTVTFTPDETTAEWTHIDTVKSQDYQVLPARSKKLVVQAGSNTITEPVI